MNLCSRRNQQGESCATHGREHQDRDGFEMQPSRASWGEEEMEKAKANSNMTLVNLHQSHISSLIKR